MSMANLNRWSEFQTLLVMIFLHLTAEFWFLESYFPVNYPLSEGEQLDTKKALQFSDQIVIIQEISSYCSIPIGLRKKS